MEKKRTYAHDLMREGGPWLGAVRTQIQTKFRNGETVTWGSRDLLTPQVTVHDLEEIAAWAVAADRNDAENRAKIAERAEKLKQSILSGGR